MVVRTVALIVLFSLGAIGTAVTALRLWKLVVLLTIYGRELATVRWHIEVTYAVLLSHTEFSIIATCANLPALFAWCRRNRNRSGPSPQQQQQQQQQQQSPQSPAIAQWRAGDAAGGYPHGSGAAKGSGSTWPLISVGDSSDGEGISSCADGSGAAVGAVVACRSGSSGASDTNRAISSSSSWAAHATGHVASTCGGREADPYPFTLPAVSFGDPLLWDKLDGRERDIESAGDAAGAVVTGPSPPSRLPPPPPPPPPSPPPPRPRTARNNSIGIVRTSITVEVWA
jgi:hypothetical protein